MIILAHPRTLHEPHARSPAKNRYLNSRLMILHASELVTELFDEVQSQICMFAISIATAKLTSVVASRALYYAIENGV